VLCATLLSFINSTQITRIIRICTDLNFQKANPMRVLRISLLILRFIFLTNVSSKNKFLFGYYNDFNLKTNKVKVFKKLKILALYIFNKFI